MLTIYRWLLMFMPGDLRGAHREDMVSLLGDRLNEAETVTARFRILCGALRDAVGVAFSSRMATWPRRPNFAGPRLRFAIRALLRRPAFSAGAILTLGLALGMLTAVWTAVDITMLRPLPYPDDAELALANGPLVTSDVVDYWNEGAPGIQRATGWSLGRSVVRGAEGSVRARSIRVGPGFLTELGARPAMGRLLNSADFLAGSPPVVVVAQSMWDSQFGVGTRLAGQTLHVDNRPVQVVGVIPNSFQLVLYRGTQLWMPLAAGEDPASAVVRMAPGRTSAEILGPLTEATLAVASLEVVSALGEQGRDPLVMQSFRDIMRGGVGESLWSLALAAAVVLLVAGANVSALFLTRTEERRIEFALRRSLGSSRASLVGDMAMEALLVAVAGGILALLAAPWILRGLLSISPGTLPDLSPLVVDGRVGLATGLASLVTVLIVGILPAIIILRGDGATKLNGRRESPLTASRLLNGLVFAEVSAAVVLMIGAGLVWRTFAVLLPSDPGFSPDDKVIVDIQLPREEYPTAQSVADFGAELQSLAPGAAGPSRSVLTTLVPFGDVWYAIPVDAIDGVPTVDSRWDAVHFRAVTPGYHEFMEIELVEGRLLSPTDQRGSRPVVVVDQAAARANWPDLPSPIGRTLTFTSGDEPVAWTVVGVVTDVRREGNRAARRPTVYVPFVQAPTWGLNWVIETDGRLAAGEIRTAVSSVDPGVPVSAIRSFDDLISNSMRLPRFQLTLMGSLAGAAIFLAGLGCFSVLSWRIRHCQRDLGIRVALGAPAGKILSQLVGSVMWIGAAGCVTGLGASWLLSSWIEANFFLQGVEPRDPATYAFTTAFVIAVLGVATIAPGRRALRVDPAITMKE